MEEAKEVRQIPIEDIVPNRFQPRINFDEKALNELSESIKQHGIIQPLVVRPLGDKFEIIAGERRYKAATLAGLQTVPSIITDMDDGTSAEVALIENVQRKDLSPIEEAKSYKNMLDRNNMTQEELAKKMGLSQSTIANKLRLLNLSDGVQRALMEQKISERHARSLLSISNKEDQINWLNRIINERLTVRQLDLAIKDEQNEKNSVAQNDGDIPKVNINPDIESIINNAVDINPQKEIKAEEIKNNESNISEPPMPNKFFNFLEDQEVNMNMSEEPEQQKKEVTNIPTEFNFTPEFNDIPENNINTEQIDTLDVEEPEKVVDNTQEVVIDEPIFSIDNAAEPQVDNSVEQEKNDESIPETINVETVEQVEESSEPINQTEEVVKETNESVAPVENNKFVFDEEPDLLEESKSEDNEEEVNIEPIPPMVGEGIVDPVTYYDTLDPDFVDKIKQSIGLDLKNAINTYRDITSLLTEKGFVINIDEADMDSTYRIQIDINKE